MIDTTLLAIGAHIIGPNRSRALSTWPGQHVHSVEEDLRA